MARVSPDPSIRISAGEAMGVFAVCTVAFLFFGHELQAYGYFGIIGSQVLMLGIPVVVFAGFKGGNVLDSLALRLPSRRDLVGAVIIGAGAWYVNLCVGAVQEAIAPIPKDLEQQFEQLFAAITSNPWMALVALVVTPAIVEEILCRAMLARSFRQLLGTAGAIVASSLLFALLHMSAYRFVPQFLIGLSLAAVTLATRSLFPAMIIHAMHNAGLIFLTEWTLANTDVRVLAPLMLVLVAGGHVVVLRRRASPLPE